MMLAGKLGLYRIVTCVAVLFALTFLFSSAAMASGPDRNCSKQVAQAAVHCAAVGLGQVLAGQADERLKVKTIAQFIDKIRFYPDQSGYFYVYNFDCVNIAHATQKNLPGKNLKDHKDTKGKYVIRELAAAAKKGGGFVDYFWVKPGTKGEHAKLGYVEPIPGTDYFIGSGVYLGK
jgi:signal transduction histidine kinase